MSNLENYYLGDEHWDSYVNLYSTFWKNTPDQIVLLKRLYDRVDIAIVVNGILGKDALRWIIGDIPALDGLKPINCVNDPVLIYRLKTVLTRMPR